MSITKSMLALALLMGSCSAIACESTALRRGMMLLEARKIMKKQGWKPLITHRHPQAGADDDDYLDAGAKRFDKAGFHEVGMCSGGQTSCLFHYRKGKECRTLVTIGESPHDAFVTHWMNTCE